MTQTGQSSVILDAAQAAKEVAALAALCLMQTGGDPESAIAMLDSVAPLVEPLEFAELDAARISQQAIREAVLLREELRG